MCALFIRFYFVIHLNAFNFNTKSKQGNEKTLAVMLICSLSDPCDAIVCQVRSTASGAKLQHGQLVLFSSFEV